MKKHYLVLCMVFLLGLLPSAQAASADAAVSVVFTHDMHSHFDPEWTVIDGKAVLRGGFARVKTVIDSLRAGYPGSLVLDAGDFSMGTPFQTIFSADAAELRLMGQMGYDATTLGNHEFDYRTLGLAQMLEAARGSGDSLPLMLTANIDWERSLAESVRPEAVSRLQEGLAGIGTRSWTIIERGGVHIAVFGVMGREADEYAPESGLIFTDFIESAKKTVAEIQADGRADMIVALSHSGTSADAKKSEDELLAKAVPEIDLILSGHTHTVLGEPLVVGHTVIGSCGSYTNYVGHVVLKRDGTRWALESYELLSVDESYEPDAAVSEAIEGFRTLASENYFNHFGYQYDQVLAIAPFDFTSAKGFGNTQGEDTLGNLISDSYAYAVRQAEGDAYVPVDVAVVPAGVVRGSFVAGDITTADVYNVSSLGIGADGVPGYPLVSVYLTGAELVTLAEVDISVSTLMSAARLYMSGLRYSYNPHRLILNRVTEVTLADGTKLDPDKLYRVIGGLYSCQMLGSVEGKSFGLLKLTPKDSAGQPITDFEQHIIKDADGREVKEWVALASYIAGFTPDGDGVAVIPDSYSRPEGRKTQENSRNLIALMRKPNNVGWIVYGAAALILALLVLIIWLVVRAVRRRRRR